MVSLIAQMIVFAASLKSKEREQTSQAVTMMLAISLITAGILIRPKAAPNTAADNTAADAVTCVGAVFLLAPGVAALVNW